MREERHTKSAWLALGREVIEGAEGILVEKKKRSGKGVLYDREYAYEETRDAQTQYIDCSTLRNMRKKKKSTKENWAKDRATFGPNGTATGGRTIA